MQLPAAILQISFLPLAPSDSQRAFFSSTVRARHPGKSGTDAYILFLRRPVPNHPFILCLFPTLVLLQARVVLEMLGAACTNALESFLGHLANFCERHRAGGVPVIHLSRKLFESPLDRFRRAPLGE